MGIVDELPSHNRAPAPAAGPPPSFGFFPSLEPGIGIVVSTRRNGHVQFICQPWDLGHSLTDVHSPGQDTAARANIESHYKTPGIIQPGFVQTSMDEVSQVTYSYRTAQQIAILYLYCLPPRATVGLWKIKANKKEPRAPAVSGR